MAWENASPVAMSTGVASLENAAPVSMAHGGATYWPAARVASTANLSSLAAIGAIDGLQLDVADRVLIKNQSSASENGIYAVDVQGTEKVTGSQTFADTVTPITVSGLTAGVLYRWTKGANTASLTNGSQVLTASGTFIAAGTSVTLLGSSAAAVLDSVKACGVSRATDAPTTSFVAGRRVAVERGASGRGVWQYTGGTYTFARVSSPVSMSV